MASSRQRRKAGAGDYLGQPTHFFPRSYFDVQITAHAKSELQTSKIGSLLDVQQSQDPEGLRNFYYLVQDIKTFIFTLITMHFKVYARRS